MTSQYKNEKTIIYLAYLTLESVVYKWENNCLLSVYFVYAF